EQGIQPIIPPRRNARLDHVGAWGTNGCYRNDAIVTTRLSGSGAWKEKVQYYQRSLVETTMFRIKKLFGDRLKNRIMENQKVETIIKVKALNMFALLATMNFW
ncbi:MAG: IS5/IS1182 family transposase, partial [Thermoguttaceae bacterium]|nr:IS5/IS1182 family transposase [Thermoguttaceae bacterium]